MKSYPNLYLIGAPKSGTTYIYNVLKKSSYIFAPINKEPAFFFLDGKDLRYLDKNHGADAPIFDVEEYCKLYSESEREKYTIDASTHYLSSLETAPKINRSSPSSKIVAVLREPVARAHSHYLMGRRDGFVREDFLSALEKELTEMKAPEVLWPEHYRFIRRSQYLDGVREFYRVFGKKRLRVYLFEDLQQDPGRVVSDIFGFLDIPSIECAEVVPQSEKNAFAEDRLPQLTRLFQLYRRSSFRAGVNKVVPVSVRRALREKFHSIRLVQTEKPQLAAEAEALIKTALGDDYLKTLEFCEKNEILRRCFSNADSTNSQ